jgi:nicotinamide-nucleotide adenylyltransferase
MQQPEPNKEHNFSVVGIIARWQPVHKGHAASLNAICNLAENVLIGIGSSNIYNFRNPFTAEETADMLHLVLAGRMNYTLIPIPDLFDGPRWRVMVKELFGELNLFFTDNPYMAELMKDIYPIAKPVAHIPENERIAVSGTMVRREMARGTDWQKWVPDKIAKYIQMHKLDQRFRQEFGLETIALDSIIQERSNS